MRWVPCLALALWHVGGHQPTQPALRSAVDAVRLDVSVTRRGEPVTGLHGRDFIVTDNGVEQDVQSVQLETMPLNVLLAFDTSASVAGSRLRQLVGAGNRLLARVRPRDRVGLLTFSHELRLLAPLTEDVTFVRAALDRTSAEGATALRDAVQMAVGLSAVDRARAVVVLFTDGADTASWTTEEATLDVARRVGVVTHVLTVGANTARVPTRYGEQTTRFLDKLVDATGGRTWTASSERDLERLVTGAFDEMRARYLLTFQPQGPVELGWHELTVRLRRGRGDVKARSGYFVGP